MATLAQWAILVPLPLIVVTGSDSSSANTFQKICNFGVPLPNGDPVISFQLVGSDPVP
jgi:hypothetical protein